MPARQIMPGQPEWLDAGREEAKDQTDELRNCRIVVLGIGEVGNNTVDRLVDVGAPNLECVAMNTDLRHLNTVRVTRKILIADEVAEGSGTDGAQKIGRAAITESAHKFDSVLNNVDAVFIAAGLDDVTGVAVAPVVAKLARKKGAIVVGFVTAPFRIGKGKPRNASARLNAMRRACDTVVVIDNNKLKESVPNHPSKEALKVADMVLANMIQGIVETISEPSLVNLDFAGFRSVVRRGGVAVVGVGESDAPNRAEEAVRNALNSPLLDMDYTGATGALVHVAGDNRMTLEEANRVGEIVTEIMGHDAQVIWSAKTNPSENGFLKVTLMMTGVNSPKIDKGYGNMMPRLYDIESSFAEPEKPLHVDLGLDQLENFAE